ncbi:hypothetical protein BGZ70_006899, partial [Mortierella alpina]
MLFKKSSLTLLALTLALSVSLVTAQTAGAQAPGDTTSTTTTVEPSPSPSTTTSSPPPVQTTDDPRPPTQPPTSEVRPTQTHQNPNPGPTKGRETTAGNVPSQATVSGATGTPTATPSPAADKGTSSLATVGIVIGAVVVAAAIGIWIFRKWKLSPSRDFQSKIRGDGDDYQDYPRGYESDTVFLRNLGDQPTEPAPAKSPYNAGATLAAEDQYYDASYVAADHHNGGVAGGYQHDGYGAHAGYDQTGYDQQGYDNQQQGYDPHGYDNYGHNDYAQSQVGGGYAASQVGGGYAQSQVGGYSQGGGGGGGGGYAQSNVGG